jgi:hypothetical protein
MCGCPANACFYCHPGLNADAADAVPLDEACRWLQMAGKLARSGKADRSSAAGSMRCRCGRIARRCCGFYDVHLDACTRPIVNPFPLDRQRGGQPGRLLPQSDGAVLR